MADVTYIPDQQGQANNILPWMLAANNGGLGGFGGNGFGGGVLGFILGLLFGNGWGGFGGFGNGFGGGAGAGFLSNQINNDNGRELLMQAITSQGEAARTATQSLSTMLGQDFNLVNTSIQGIQNALNTIGANQGMNALQVINAIQSGNASLGAQFQQCCCENRLGLCQLGNTIQQGLNANAVAAQQGFSGVQQSIASKAASLSSCISLSYASGIPFITVSKVIRSP